MFSLLIGCQTFQSSGRPQWLYQLQNYKNPIPTGPNQLVVVDISYPYTLARKTLCYLSIGEAEDYRDYFTGLNKELISQENPKWQGNYPVKYWKESWKNIIFKNKNSYLENIIKKSFTGVYLDIVDAFHSYPDKKKYAELMAIFIIELSQIAKQKKADFKIYIQNGVDIVTYLNTSLQKKFLAAIDGISLEAVFFEYDEKNEVKGLSPHIAFYSDIIRKYYRGKLDILSVEYLKNEQDKLKYRELSQTLALKPLVTDKLLKGLYFKAP